MKFTQGVPHLKIIVCIDERFGMLFFGKRLSRDSIMLEDMKAHIGEDRLYCHPFSEKLLDAADIKYKSRENFLDKAKDDDFCFVENTHIRDYMEDVSELVIYNWNRHYPSDMQLDIIPGTFGLSLADTKEFAGSSHEKITKEIYRR